MSTSYERYQKRKLISSYFSVVLSIFLVLFLLGTLGLFLLNFKQLSNNFKENIPMSLYFKDQAGTNELENFKTKIEKSAFIKNITFVHKDSAALTQQGVIGENFVHFLGFNPLQNSFDLHLKGDYINKDSITSIVTNFKENKLIDDIVYDQNLIDLVNKNIETITSWILTISFFLAFISMLLINSSLRLSVYSKRFTIKTMQMVGATKSFIRKPFIWTNIRLGLVGAFFALIAIGAEIYYLQTIFTELKLLENTSALLIIGCGVVLVGILITWISTFFATQRFLNLKSDELY